MAIVALKCPHCSGDLELDDGREFGFCMYCGTKIMITKDNSGKSSLEGQVDNLKPLMNSYFKAGDVLEAQKYARKIIDINGADADVWYVEAVAEMYRSPDGSEWEGSLKNYEIASGREVDVKEIEEKCRQYALSYVCSGKLDHVTHKWIEKEESFEIPTTWTTIKEVTFDGWSALKSITIPSSVKSIGDNAFNKCTSLESVTIPSSVESIGKLAFIYCSSLKSIAIPASVKKIDRFTFGACSSLKSVTIPSSVESIGDLAFSYCTSLESVTIPSSVKSIGAQAFEGCSSLKSVTIPSSVESIGNAAFRYCRSLEKVSLPPSANIGAQVFEGCHIKPSSPEKSKGGLFGRRKS